MLVLFQIGSLPPKDLGKHNITNSFMNLFQATLALQSRLKIIESPT